MLDHFQLDGFRRACWPVVAVLLTLASIGSAVARENPRRSDREGLLQVYLEPLGSDAARLGIRLGSVSAEMEDGSSIPLYLDLREFRGVELNRQRRLASGSLPPGNYRGLSLTIDAATLDRGDGETAMRFATESIPVPVSFRLEARQGVVLSLQLDYSQSVAEAYQFVPRFHAYPPPRPASGLLGLVSSRDADVVTVFDKNAGRVVGAIPTGPGPSGIVLDRLRNRAYVALAQDDQVVELDLLDFRVLNSVRLRGGDEPTWLEATPDRATLLAVGRGSRVVSFIDPSSMVELDRTSVGDEPEQILVSDDGARAFVLNGSSSNITVIDLRTRSVAATIATEPGPYRCQFDRSGENLYVIHSSSPFLSLVDTERFVVENTVYVGPGASALLVNPATDLIYLSRRGTGEIEVFEPLSLLPIDAIPIPAAAGHMVLDAEQNLLFVSQAEADEVLAIETVAKRPRARLDVAASPNWLAVAGER